MKGGLPRKRNNRGFSLVEIIIVIAIMAALTAVLVPSYINYVSESRKSVCEVNRAEIERLFIVDDYSPDTRETAEALAARLALEYAEDICPDGGVSAECFTIVNNKLCITCRVHGADGPSPAINWRNLAATLESIREVVEKNKNKTYTYAYTTGQVYCANDNYFVFTGRSCSAKLPFTDDMEVLEQALYEDLADWADNDMGKKVMRFDPDAEQIVYEGAEKQPVQTGDMTTGSDGAVYIYISGNTTSKSPDEELKSTGKLKSW